MKAFDDECLAVAANRNELEAYVLDGQTDFAEGGKFYSFMTTQESEQFMSSIFASDDFLGDDDFDQEANVYKERLDSLSAVGSIYEKRANEWEKRPKVLETFKKLLNSCESFVSDLGKSEAYSHIPDNDEKVIELTKVVKDAAGWLDNKFNLHQKAVKAADAPFQSSEISSKYAEINLALNAVKNIPRPEPQNEEKKDEKPTTEDGKKEDTSASTETKPDETMTEEKDKTEVESKNESADVEMKQ
eukprot:UN24866